MPVWARVSSLFAEDGHARVFHAAPVRRLGDACQGVPLDAYNLFLHKI